MTVLPSDWHQYQFIVFCFSSYLVTFWRYFCSRFVSFFVLFAKQMIWSKNKNRAHIIWITCKYLHVFNSREIGKKKLMSTKLNQYAVSFNKPKRFSIRISWNYFNEIPNNWLLFHGSDFFLSIDFYLLNILNGARWWWAS